MTSICKTVTCNKCRKQRLLFYDKDGQLIETPCPCKAQKKKENRCSQDGLIAGMGI